MDEEEALATFLAITNAPEGVARHVLEAHGFDLDASVSFYLESGGVGFGDDMEVIEEDEVQVMASRPDPRPQSRPLPARAAPRSSPIVISDDDFEVDDDDDGLQVLASSSRRARADRLAQRAPGGAGAGDGELHAVGSFDDDGVEPPSGQRRVRRSRPRGAAAADADLDALGQRFGRDAHAAPAPTRSRGRRGAPWGPPEPGRGDAAPPHPGVAPPDDAGDGVELPGDVDLEEQRMLMAAVTGVPYEGRPGRTLSGRSLSPGAAERARLRDEQDWAYRESLQADRKRAEAAECAAREAEEAEAACTQAKQEEEAREREAAERLERQLSSKAAALPPEPPANDPGTVRVAVRLPGGGRHSRLFRTTDYLRSVFDFVDVENGGAGEAPLPGSYHLVMQYPRRVFEPGCSDVTLGHAGLVHKQEALFLEAK